MKTVFLIKKDSEFLWSVKGVNPVMGQRHLWGSKYSEHVREFKTFEDAANALDNLPEYLFMGAPYFEIVKFLKK